MKRIALIGLLLTVVVIAAGATMRTASLAGMWAATYSGHSLVLQLQGSGPTYKGTYSVIDFVKQKDGATKKLTTSIPVTARVVVTKKQINVALTFLNVPKHTASCLATGSKLECVAPFGQKLIVFTHVHR